jgi:hypothetical protein
MKNIELPPGVTFVHDEISFSNKADEFGLYIKLTKGASEIVSVDVILL